MSRFARGLLAYLFVHTGIGGPVSWIRLHHVRDHYQNAAPCPRYFGYAHSALRDFFWNLHLRFVPRDPKKYTVPAEDENDPWLAPSSGSAWSRVSEQAVGPGPHRTT